MKVGVMMIDLRQKLLRKEITGECPGCQAGVKVTMQQVLAGERVRCSHCGGVIELDAKKEGPFAVGKALDEIERKLKGPKNL